MSEYEAELTAWKAKHGITAAGPVVQEELRMLAEDQASTGKSWCLGCDVWMPIRDMKLITRRIDPYTQTFDGAGDYIPRNHRVRMCPKCFESHYSRSEPNE